jgi:hypothetical protein
MELVADRVESVSATVRIMSQRQFRENELRGESLLSPGIVHVPSVPSSCEAPANVLDHV